MIWCQFGLCIARFSHTEALGEADVKNRAMHEGWRVDALGRLACPLCVQHDATFMVIYPPVLATWSAGHDDELTVTAGQPAESAPGRRSIRLGQRRATGAESHRPARASTRQARLVETP